MDWLGRVAKEGAVQGKAFFFGLTKRSLRFFEARSQFGCILEALK